MLRTRYLESVVYNNTLLQQGYQLSRWLILENRHYNIIFNTPSNFSKNSRQNTVVVSLDFSRSANIKSEQLTASLCIQMPTCDRGGLRDLPNHRNTPLLRNEPSREPLFPPLYLFAELYCRMLFCLLSV